MRVKFKALNENWKAEVLALPLYAESVRNNTSTLVISCDECGEWLPPKSGANLCVACAEADRRARGVIRECANPECNRELITPRNARKYCCDDCREAHKTARFEERKAEMLRLQREERLSLPDIAKRLCVSQSVVNHALYTGPRRAVVRELFSGVSGVST
jgi:predicted DNA-binding protein (UPF0251 family)